MRVAIYARISDDKEGAGLGVQRQVRDCLANVCDARGWTDTEVYADNDRSAYSGKPRPEYERMLEDARAGRIDAIVAWHNDRLHRSPRELETFIEIVEAGKIQVDTARSGMLDLSTPSGRLVARQLGAVARYESEHKSDRQKAKAADIARKGGVGGGGARPFGFEEDRVTIRESEAEIIRDLVDRLLAGETLRSLAVDLNARGIRTPANTRRPDGGEWVPSPTLRRMLRSARISGQREHKGEIVATAVWPAIITPEQTRRVRALLDDPRRRSSRPPQKYLLTGVLRCSLCRAALVARPRDDGKRRYVCAKDPGFSGCGGSYVLAESIEEFAVEAVLHRLDTPELAAEFRGRRTQDVDGLGAQILGLQAELDDLAEARGAKQITTREWLIAKAPLQAQLDEVKRRESRTSAGGLLGEHIGKAGELRERWPGISFDRRHAIIKAALGEVLVRPGRRGYNRFDPTRFDLIWR